MFFPVPPRRETEPSSPLVPGRYRPVGVWCALGTNALVFCGGAACLFIETGARPQWMRPASEALLILTLLTAGCGSALSTIVSTCEVIYPGRRWAGAAGVFLSFAPWVIAIVVADFFDFGFDK